MGHFFEMLRNSAPGRAVRNAPSVAKLIVNPTIPAERKRACLDFYFSGAGIRRLFATLPRSGFHYMVLMVDVALDLNAGGSGAYRYCGGVFRSQGGRHDVALDWRWKLGQLAYEPAQPCVFHTHMPYYRNTCWALPDMCTVVLVRNVWDTVESLINYHDITPDEYDAFLMGRRRGGKQPDFPFNFQEVLRFFNSWGTALRRDNVTALRYEDLVRNPAAEVMRVATLWELDIPRECIEQAVQLCSKDNMKSKLAEAEVEATRRVRFEKTKIDFTHGQLDYMRRRLQRGRYTDFGYPLEP